MYSILLVEDEITIRENIRKGILWEQYGFYIHDAVSNGEEALESLEKFQPDILLTDIRMPFMDGLELSRIVRKLVPEIRIIILSGYMEFAYAKEAITLGVEEYLVKPITPMKVVRTFTALKEKMDRELQVSENYNMLVNRLRETEARLSQLQDGRINTEDLVNERKREEKLREFLQSGRCSDAARFAQTYVNDAGARLGRSRTFTSYFLSGTILSCVKEFEMIGGDPQQLLEEISDPADVAMDAGSREAVCEEVRKLLVRILSYRDKVVDRSYDVVGKAEKYIKDHYQEANLSASDVARYVGLSTSHFSCIFKQQMGAGFVKYLTQVRIEQAKLLLCSTPMTTAEIAELVGYSNSNYFSMVFHKNVGMTAMAYRGKENRGT